MLTQLRLYYSHYFYVKKEFHHQTRKCEIYKMQKNNKLSMRPTFPKQQNNEGGLPFFLYEHCRSILICFFFHHDQ